MKTDRWIVKKLRNRDEKGIHEIIDTYAGLLYSIIGTHSRGYEAYHDECFNDVLLGIWNNIGSFDEKKGSFKNWICAIARYKALNLVRDKRKYLMDEEFEENKIVDPRSYNEESIVLRQEIEDMLSCLNEEDKGIFIDLFYKGLSVREVSQDRKISEASIYKRVSRGRGKIKEKREDY